jgi:hypothetical protein
VTADLEARLTERANRDGLVVRVDEQPDGSWTAGFWSPEPLPGIAQDGAMMVGADGPTRDAAVADLAAIVDVEDDSR